MGLLAIIIIVFVIVAIYFATNVHAAFGGTVNSNLHAYFTARKRGYSHREALEWMIQTRYPTEPDKRAMALNSISNSNIGQSELYDLQNTIHCMFYLEQGPDATSQFGTKIFSLVEKKYNKMIHRL